MSATNIIQWRWGRRDRRVGWRFIFEPCDLWIGLFWKRIKGTTMDDALHLYVCVIPTLVVQVCILDRRAS